MASNKNETISENADKAINEKIFEQLFCNSFLQILFLFSKNQLKPNPTPLIIFYRPT